jgi:hypothetical protein
MLIAHINLRAMADAEDKGGEYRILQRANDAMIQA